MLVRRNGKLGVELRPKEDAANAEIARAKPSAAEPGTTQSAAQVRERINEMIREAAPAMMKACNEAMKKDAERAMKKPPQKETPATEQKMPLSS